ncbi:MAG: lipocalin family protein [Chitinophagaceae bacterium]|nr:lipocalin family protein [Chitinophagaceae bacterium]
MKKSTWSLFLALSLMSLVFTSCKKDDEVSTKDRLTGKWNLIKMEGSDFSNGTSTPYNEQFEPGSYLQFNSNNSVIVNADGSVEAGIWSVNDNKLTLTDSSDIDDAQTFDIKKLTGNELQIYIKETFSGGDYYEETLFLTK